MNAPVNHDDLNVATRQALTETILSPRFCVKSGTTAIERFFAIRSIELKDIVIVVKRSW